MHKELLLIVGMGVAGCGTTSETSTLASLGQFQDRVLLKQSKTHVFSSPWTGAVVLQRRRILLVHNGRFVAGAMREDVVAPPASEQTMTMKATR